MNVARTEAVYMTADSTIAVFTAASFERRRVEVLEGKREDVHLSTLQILYTIMPYSSHKN